MKKQKITKVELVSTLIQKYFEDKDVVNLRKLFKRTKFDLITQSLIKVDDPAVVLFLLMAINKNKTSTIYRYLPDELQDEILDIASNNQIKIIFSEMYPDEILDIADRDNKKHFKKIFLNLSVQQRELLKQIDKFEHDEAGSFMNPEFISFNNEWTINKCLEIVKQNFKKFEENLVIFVTSKNKLLVGQVHLQDLFFCENYKTKISSIMTESFLSVKSNDDIETVINLFTNYHYENIAVLDNDNHLIGVINDNDILPAIEEEVTEDIYNMYGIQKTDESYMKSTIWKIVKSRFLWILILMISATLTSIVISLFETLGAELTAGLSSALLVPIIPVITGTSGNTGSQAFATTVRAMAIGDVTPKEYRKAIFKEFKIGVLLGMLLAIVNIARLAIYFAIPAFRMNNESHTVINYSHAIYIALGSSIALWFAVFLSKLFGSTLPMLATKLKLDPTILCGPLIATSLDLTSTSLLFGIGIGILQIVIH